MNWSYSLLIAVVFLFLDPGAEEKIWKTHGKTVRKRNLISSLLSDSNPGKESKVPERFKMLLQPCGPKKGIRCFTEVLQNKGETKFKALSGVKNNSLDCLLEGASRRNHNLKFKFQALRNLNIPQSRTIVEDEKKQQRGVCNLSYDCYARILIGSKMSCHAAMYNGKSKKLYTNNSEVEWTPPPNYTDELEFSTVFRISHKRIVLDIDNAHLGPPT